MYQKYPIEFICLRSTKAISLGRQIWDKYEVGLSQFYERNSSFIYTTIRLTKIFF